MTPENAKALIGSRGFRTLVETARAILPAGGVIAPGADETGVALEVARGIGALPASGRASLRAMLAAWEMAPLASRHFSRFSRLGEAGRAAYLESAEKQGWRRAMLLPLKTLCVAAYAAHPQVADAIGFDHRCLDASPPRPGPRLRPKAYPAISGEVDVKVDVVVVGSGAGGAVVAKELAERGLSVAVVEEGAYFTQQDFQGSLPDRMRRLYRDGGLTLALGRPFVPVPLGKAVGGTTVVNSGTCFRPPDEVLKAWETEWGIEGVAPDAMAGVFDRVERTIHVKPVPEELLGENARVFRRGLAALGIEGAPIRRNIDGCRGCGVCAFGCPSDAKQAMHLSYLPRAERAGASVYARCRVTRILTRGGRAAGVEAQILSDGDGATVAAEVQGRLRIRADHVVLAAGAVHTPLLLMASGAGSPRSVVGRNLRVHPAVGVTAQFDEDVYGWRGTLQPYFTDAYRESHGLLFEVTSPLPGLSAAGVPGVGEKLKNSLADYRKIASVGLFVADSTTGRVRRMPGGEPWMTYQLGETDTRRLVSGIEIAARIFFAAGARRVYPGIPEVPVLESPSQIQAISEASVKAASLAVAGFHPVGTARMGDDPQRCAVDPSGESYALPGLFVADGSVFPDCVGVNPQVTIMAMATRIAWRLADRLGARAVDDRTAP